MDEALMRGQHKVSSDSELEKKEKTVEYQGKITNEWNVMMWKSGSPKIAAVSCVQQVRWGEMDWRQCEER